jgi:hypothetical protein
MSFEFDCEVGEETEVGRFYELGPRIRDIKDQSTITYFTF